MILRARRAALILVLVGSCSVSFASSDQPNGRAADLLEHAFQLDEGKPGPRDPAAAAALYAQAAALGDAYAHLRLGYLCEVGDGVPQDYVAARTHYLAAADAGLSDGHLHLALCWLEGWGGPADRAAFGREMTVAAEAGNVNAQTILAAMYFSGLGVVQNDAAAVSWLERAAKGGDAYAEYRIGLHREGERVRALMHDESLARSWYQLSAEKDYAQSMRAMARTFLTGEPGNRNWTLGRKWLQLASDGGDAEAPYILAAFEVLHVDSPHRDEATAMANLQLAAQRGNERATEVLQLRTQGRPLADAFRYVLLVPFEDRYVQRANHTPHDGPTHLPIVYELVEPVYPLSLRLTGTTGKVVVDFVVDTKGQVRNAHAIQSSHPLFAERAVRAVEQWRFYPGKKNGHLVNAHMQVPVMFTMNEEELQGVEGLLTTARQLAEDQGSEVMADATELRMAVPSTPLTVPVDATGTPLTSAQVLVLLALDETGAPIRAHVLKSNPPTVGGFVLAAAMKGHFVPRQVAGKFQPSHVLLVYRVGESLTPIIK